LKKLNIEENTLIIITADHGEEICEHGRCFAHAAYLWEPLIRVPLIITWKGHLVNKRKSCQVQLIDIAPTICDILKIKKPPYFEGKSLLPLIRGSKCQPRPAFSEHQNRQDQKTSGTLFSTEFSIRLDSWKLICTAYPNWKKYELYDLKNDPGELNDLSEIEKARLDFLKNKLEVWQKRKKPDAVPIEKALHEETRDRLKSLGYLN